MSGDLERMVAMWEYRGQKKPPFAEAVKEGHESVWDYPRPPSVHPCQRLVIVYSGGDVLARSKRTYRVLETASPPGYYIPREDVIWKKLAPAPGHSMCEWKGVATYWSLSNTPEATAVGWSYEEPTPNYRLLKGCLSFYPGRVDCYVDGEKVRPQPGRFYGGWITAEVIGPFKGPPGTEHW